MKREQSLSTLASHPPQRLQDSHYFNYHNSVCHDSDYLLRKQTEQQQLLRDTHNFKVVCDRNYLATSQYHAQQKFGHIMPRPKVYSAQLQQQREAQLKNQDKKHKMHLRRTRSNISVHDHTIKMVLHSDKIEMGLTLQFNSLQVQLSLLGEPKPKRVVSHCYSFEEMLPFLDRTNPDILASLQHHLQSQTNPIDKNLPKCRLEQLDKTKQAPQSSYMPCEEVVDLQVADQSYRLKVIYPKITFYVPNQLYEQTLRISRESIRAMVQNQFKGLESFVQQFNKKRMQNQIKIRKSGSKVDDVRVQATSQLDQAPSQTDQATSQPVQTPSQPDQD